MKLCNTTSTRNFENKGRIILLRKSSHSVAGNEVTKNGIFSLHWHLATCA